MATPLDIGVLKSFEILFPMIFVLIITYAVFSYTRILGENKAIAAILSFVLAISTLFSTVALKTINMMAPWFVLFFIFAIFVLATYQLFGMKEDAITGIWQKWHSGGSTLFWWILAIVVIIGFGSLLTVLGEEGKPPVYIEDATDNGDDEPQMSFWSTLTNPQVLGAVLILLIAMFAIKNLAEERHR